MQLRQASERTAGWESLAMYYLDCITPVRFSIRGTDKGETECRGSMSDQLIVFFRGAFVMVCKD